MRRSGRASNPRAIADFTGSGALPQPFFRQGVTTAEEFRRQLDELPAAPRVQLMSAHTVLTLECATAMAYRSEDLGRLLDLYEQGLAAEDAFAGLDGSTALDSRSPLPYHFVFSDYRKLGGAYTTQGFIAIGPSWTGSSLASKRLLKPVHQALWREMGHAHQTKAVFGSTYTERGVDIYGNVALRAVTALPAFDKPTWDKALKDIAGWKAGVDDAVKNTSPYRWSQVACLDQIRLESGDQAWTTMEKLIRANAIPLAPLNGPTAFAAYLSEAVGYDVAPHFERCGYPVDAKAKTAIAALHLPAAPPPSRPAPNGPSPDPEDRSGPRAALVRWCCGRSAAGRAPAECREPELI
ncbi:M60 family metallopeptidase [Kitasatospora sp. NPDC094019]|uniref:M60 family metallopeptidase n=1 Tax=Kitasatospora sp. NPDC094019 TaxID=3364091 RepID=UPI0037F295DC